MGNNNVDNNMQANMQVNMQTIASLMQQHGFSIGDNMMQKGLAALPDTPRLGAGHVAATPLAFAAPVPQVAALGDVSPAASSQDSQVESPCMSQSPTKNQAGGRHTASVPGGNKAMVRTGAGGSGDARGSHAHGSQPYPR